MESINLGIVDDQKLFCSALNRLLGAHKDINVQIIANSGKELLFHLNNVKDKPNIILLDVEMKDLNGFETLKILKNKYPDIKVIMLTCHEESRYIISLIEQGAVGFMNKNCDEQELLETIRGVHTQGYFFSKKVVTALHENLTNQNRNNEIFSMNGNTLITMELKVLDLLCMGKSAKEIASILFLSPRTVEHHKASIIDKTNTKSTLDLVVYAFSNRLVEI